MKKMSILLVLVLTFAMSSVFAEQTTDVTLEWSDFTTEYVNFTSYSSASKEVALQVIEEDAIAYVATNGLEQSLILTTVFENIREQHKDLNTTDSEIAEKIINGQINVIIK